MRSPHRALLCGLLAQPQPPAGGEKPVAARDGGEFGGKYVALNFKQGGRNTAAVLSGVTVRSLGGRSFLVGEHLFAEGDDSAADWKGVAAWVPVDAVECLHVFGSREQARKAAEAARQRPVDR